MKDSDNIDTATRKWAVVDDEEVVLEVLEAMLGAITGAELVAFTDPVAAIAAIRSEPQAFEMLITDRRMPQLDGVDLLVLAREVASHLRFVVVTGNTFKLKSDLDQFNLPHSVINKPFDVKKLETAIVRAGSLHLGHEETDTTTPAPARDLSESTGESHVVRSSKLKALQVTAIALGSFVATTMSAHDHSATTARCDQAPVQITAGSPPIHD